MIGGEAESGQNELQKKIMYLERIAFDRGIADLKMPAAQKFGEVVLNSRIESLYNGEKKASLLVIDDDVEIRTIIREYFEPLRFKVLEATNSEEGIKCQFENIADIIIVEIILPGIDGIETILTIRERFPDVKIIGMSRGGWYGTEIDFDMAEKLGALTIHKPFLLKNLETMVNGFLNGAYENECQHE